MTWLSANYTRRSSSAAAWCAWPGELRWWQSYRGAWLVDYAVDALHLPVGSGWNSAAAPLGAIQGGKRKKGASTERFENERCVLSNDLGLSPRSESLQPADRPTTKHYLQDFTRTPPFCTCPDHTKRGGAHDACKHVKAGQKRHILSSFPLV
jgi:hypothetical protein